MPRHPEEVVTSKPIRPSSLTLIGAILALIGISGIGGLVSMPNFGDVVASQLLRASPSTVTLAVRITLIVYVGATCIAAFAVLKMRPWASKAYVCFAASLMAFLGVFSFLIRMPGTTVTVPIFMLVISVVLYFGWRKVTSGTSLTV
jgi:hypothetical protein